MNHDPQPQGFGAFLKGYFKNLWHTLTHPWLLLPTLIISGAWIALGILHTRMGETQVIKILNFFTFAQGGLFGGTVGAVGGILGKILIATLLNALVMPLFMKGSRPFARFGKGFGGFFRSFAFDSLRAMSVFLMGIGIALLIYSFFNITQRWQESLVGVTAAILLIRTIGQRGGFLFSLLFSFVRAFSRNKAPSYMGVSRFLSGMVLGMTLAVGLNAFGLRWCIAFAAGALLISLIFIWFGKRQRAAFTVVSITAMLMIPVYADSPSMQGQMPQEMQELYNRASDYEGINKKVEALEKQYEAAAARDDVAEMDRIANEIAKIYMGQANDAMDLYKMAQQYGNGAPIVTDGGPDSDEHQPLSPEDEQFLRDINPFGKGPAADDNDWKPTSPDGGFRSGDEKDASFDDIVDKAKELGTEGWADDDSREDDETEVSLLEGIGAGVGLGAGAGAAAGASGAGGAGGGGGLPDLPDGSWDMDEAERREEEEDGEDDAEPTEGGDGGKDPFQNNPHVQNHGDGSLTMTSPATGEQITLIQKDDGTWENPMSGAQYDDNDINNWVQDQEDNAGYYQDKAATDAAYQDAFDKDADKFKSTSDQERINEEVAKDMEKWEEEQHLQDLLQSIRDDAEDMGIATTDADGNERSIDDILDDMKDKYVKDTLRENWKEWQATQQEAAQEELDASLALADAELVDNVSEGTVNVLAEYVPGGSKVKDFHTFTKATAVGATEGYLKDGWTGAAKGGAAGAAEGAVGVVQNHLSDITKGATGNEAVDKMAADVLNVQLEGVKVMIHDVSRGKDVEELYSDLQEATVKKTGDVLVGRILGDGLGMSDSNANAVGEFISKGHDDIKWGGNGNPEEDKTLAGHIASGWQNFKDKTAEKMCDLYYGNK